MASEFITAEEKAVQYAINGFWYEHYSKFLSTDERNELVESFASQWLDSTKIKVDKPAYYHPATRLKTKIRKCSIAEILADFILAVNQNEEKSQAYPINNADAEFARMLDRQTNELSIYTKELSDEFDKLPPYSVHVDDLPEAYKYKEPISIKKYRGELRKVKINAEALAEVFYVIHGKDKADTKKRIHAMNLDNIRECTVCGNAFYARNGREICDQQRGIKVSKRKGKKSVFVLSHRSACDLINDRKRAEKHREIAKVAY